MLKQQILSYFVIFWWFKYKKTSVWKFVGIKSLLIAGFIDSKGNDHLQKLISKINLKFKILTWKEQKSAAKVEWLANEIHRTLSRVPLSFPEKAKYLTKSILNSFCIVQWFIYFLDNEEHCNHMISNSNKKVNPKSTNLHFFDLSIEWTVFNEAIG